MSASATGGTGNDQFKLDGGLFQVSGSFSGASAGPHTITAEDANGCTGTTPVTITVPTQVVASATPTNPSCFGGRGSVSASATGGTGT